MEEFVDGINPEFSLDQVKIPSLDSVDISGKGDPVVKKQTGSQPAVPNTVAKTKADDDYNRFYDMLQNNASELIFGGAEDRFGDIRPLGYDPSTQKNINQNFERYYSHPSNSKLGFNPWRDNDTLYNTKGSATGDLWRATKAGLKAIPNGFMSNIYSYGDIFTGDAFKSADEVDDTSMSMSTRGGITGFASNLIASSGNTIGMLGETLVEGLIGAALTPETGGASAVLAAERVGLTVTKLGQYVKNIANMEKAVAAMKNFSASKEVYGALRGTAKFLNPLGNTWDAIKTLKNSENAVSLARMTGSTLGGFHRDMMELNATFSESKMEAASTKQSLKDDFTSEFFRANGRQPDANEGFEIDKQADEAAQATLFGNIPAIYLTNKLTIAPLVKRFQRLDPITLAKTGTKIAQNAVTKEFYKETLSTAVKGLLKPKMWGKGSLKYFTENLSEGFQESVQDVISGTAKDYYKSQYYNETRQGNDTSKGEYPSFMGSLGKSVESQFSGEGFETFASGFLMGGLIKPLGGLANVAMEQSKRLQGKEAYQQYKLQRQNYEQTAIANLNEANKKITSLFSVRDNRLADASNTVLNQNNSQLTNDSKTFYDVKNQNDWSLITSVFEQGNTDLLIDQLKSIKTMPAEEIEKAYPGTKGTEVLEDVDKMVDKANYLQNAYKQVNNKYVNPFQPKKYKEGTDEHTQQFLGYRAWEDAKQQMVFYGYSMDKTLGRISTVTNELVQLPEFNGMNSVTMTTLLNPLKLNNEISMLTQEVKTLTGSETSEAKQTLRDKQKKLNNFTNLQAALEDYQAYTVPNGVEVPEAFEKGKAKSYDQLERVYTKILADFTNETGNKGVSLNVVENSFKQFLDVHDLNKDYKDLTQTVDLLANPKGFTTHVQNLENHLKDLWENKEKLAEDAVKNTYDKIETNQLLNALYNSGFTVSPEELNEILGGKLPITYYDAAGKTNGNEQSSTYEEFSDIVTRFQKMTGKKPLEESVPSVVEDPQVLDTTKSVIVDKNVNPIINPKTGTSDRVFDYKSKLVEVKTLNDYNKLEQEFTDLFEDYGKMISLGITPQIEEAISNELAKLKNNLENNAGTSKNVNVGDQIVLKETPNITYRVIKITDKGVVLAPFGNPTETKYIDINKIETLVEKIIKMGKPVSTKPTEEVAANIEESNAVVNTFMDNATALKKAGEKADELGENKVEDEFNNDLKC